MILENEYKIFQERKFICCFDFYEVSFMSFAKFREGFDVLQNFPNFRGYYMFLLTQFSISYVMQNPKKIVKLTENFWMQKIA